MSARLFACYTLVSELPQSNEHPPGRTTRRGKSSQHPILSLLQSLVHVESSSLGHTVEKKTVQFSAYEGSATRPPRDSVLGSHVPRHVNINAMVSALEQVNAMLCQSENDRKETLDCLQALSTFLNQIECAEEGKRLRDVCAKSMPFRWDPQRFRKAARLYHRDVEKLCQCMETNASLSEADVQLNLEKKLAESLGRAIRYHLRRFFNSIYGKVIEDPGLTEAPFRRQSKIHEILRMTLPSWYCAGAHSAVADGSISSVFALAIETIEREFGVEPFLALEFKVPDIPDSFCQSEASQRGLGGRAKTSLPESDVETILSETCAAQGFLAGAKACRFVTELLTWPGVDAEINRLGGWGIIEQCAKQFRDFHLDRVSPHEVHFVLLSDMMQLRERVQQCEQAMEHALNECTTALNDQWLRFDCDNTKKGKSVPIIGILRDLLLEGLKAHMFPTVAKPDYDNDKDCTSELTETECVDDTVASASDEKENCHIATLA